MLKNWLRSMAKEPFVYFVLIGAGLYGLYALTQPPGQAMADKVIWLPESLNPAALDATERVKLKAMMDNEVMFREAWRLGLYEQDNVIRNRLIQKMRFAIMEDIAGQMPDEAQIMALYNTRTPESMLPERYTFEQRFFSNNKPLTHAAVQRLLERLNSGERIDGQAFHLGHIFSAQSTEKMSNHFGAQFASDFKALDVQNTTHWQGPVTSVYGIHVIKVNSYLPAQQAPFDMVRDRLADSLANVSNRQAFENKLLKIAARYPVKYE